MQWVRKSSVMACGCKGDVCFVPAGKLGELQAVGGALWSMNSPPEPCRRAVGCLGSAEMPLVEFWGKCSEARRRVNNLPALKTSAAHAHLNVNMCVCIYRCVFVTTAFFPLYMQRSPGVCDVGYCKRLAMQHWV